MRVESDQQRSKVTALQPVLHECDVLVLDAVLRQSLVAIRSLGQKNFRVTALETTAHTSVPAFSSSWCEQSAYIPAAEGTAQYLAYLDEVLAQTRARVVITSSDGTIALLRAHRQRLEERHTRIALAQEPALKQAVDKEQTLALAKELGIGVPPCVIVKTGNDVAAAIAEVGLPVVIKPAESWVDNTQHRVRFGTALATTLTEAQVIVEEPLSLGASMLFQPFLPGRREALSFLYAHNTTYARFAQWAKRTEPQLGGTSVMRQSIAIPNDIGVQAEKLIRAMDLEGYSEVEFRRDAAGKPFLMEINPRLSASVEIAVRSGMNFPYLLYQWANGEPIQPVQTYRTGRWMRYLRGDFFTTVEALQKRGRPGVTPAGKALWEFGSSFFTPTGYDYLDWRDPGPAFVSGMDFMKNRVGKALTRKMLRLVR